MWDHVLKVGAIVGSMSKTMYLLNVFSMYSMYSFLSILTEVYVRVKIASSLGPDIAVLTQP